ncbi:MAG: T9SS type A sorting domain-containing protein, partial [Ignavibacteriales bacterium]
TKIKFQIPEKEFVTLKVFDVLGNEVAELVNRELSSGSYEIEFSTKGFIHGVSTTGFASGVYFYQLKAGTLVETKKMILSK